MATPVIATCNGGHQFRTEVISNHKGMVKIGTCDSCTAPVRSHLIDFGAIEERQYAQRRNRGDTRNVTA